MTLKISNASKDKHFRSALMGKFTFGFPSKKRTLQDQSSGEAEKKKPEGQPESSSKKFRSTVIDADDEQDFLTSAGISSSEHHDQDINCSHTIHTYICRACSSY